MNYLELAEKLLASGYDVFGVRGDDREFAIGEEMPASNDWDYDNDCMSEDKLNGVCATMIGEKYDDAEELAESLKKRIEFNKRYASQQYLIGGSWGYEMGVDENEIIINGAEVIVKL